MLVPERVDALSGSMHPAALFRHCPRCGSAQIRFDPDRRLLCDACGLEYYINVAAAVGVILSTAAGVLVTVRRNEPGRGLLDLPGGFVDPGETMEEAARREIHEELGLRLGELHYLGSGINQYEYKNITYHTLDAFFHCRLTEEPVRANPDEIMSIQFVNRDEFRPELFAFESNRKILGQYFQIGLQ